MKASEQLAELDRQIARIRARILTLLDDEEGNKRNIRIQRAKEQDLHVQRGRLARNINMARHGFGQQFVFVAQELLKPEDYERVRQETLNRWKELKEYAE